MYNILGIKITKRRMNWMVVGLIVLIAIYMLTGFSCVDKITPTSNIEIEAYGIKSDGSLIDLRSWKSFLRTQTITDTQGNPLVGIALCPFLTVSKTDIGAESEVDIVYTVTYASKDTYGYWVQRIERPNSSIDPSAWYGQGEYNYVDVSGTTHFWRMYHPDKTEFWLEDPAVKYSALCPAGFTINGFSPFVMVFDEAFFDSVCSYNESFWVSTLNMQEGATTDVRFIIEVSIRRNNVIEKIGVGTATFQIIYTSGGDPIVNDYNIDVDFKDWVLDNPTPPPTGTPVPPGDTEPTTLTLTATPSTLVNVSQYVGLTATLKRGGLTPAVISGKRVDIINVDTGQTVGSGQTDFLGRVSVTVQETVAKNVRYIAYFWGDTTYNGSESNMLTVYWGSTPPTPEPPPAPP